MKGTVKFFNNMKRFGFITGEDGNEYFFHETNLKEGVTVGENDKVSFEVEQGDRGPKAVNVALDAEEQE
ncbi:cold shock domain-containing protein [Candidatus Woesearchaeota archaeon]|nr:cold shock domain-containing protein [Candidatus Woesearchaeota archaeon]